MTNPLVQIERTSMYAAGVCWCADAPISHQLATKVFYDQVERGEHWLWRGACYPNGHGRFRHRPSIDENPRTFAYRLTVGELGPRRRAATTCGVELCVRTEHLKAAGAGYPAKLDFIDVNHLRHGQRVGLSLTVLSHEVGLSKGRIEQLLRRK